MHISSATTITKPKRIATVPILTVTSSNIKLCVTVHELVNYVSVCPEVNADMEVGSASLGTGLLF